MEKDISTYLNNGIQHIVSDVLQHTFENPRETEFLLSFIRQSKRSEKIRAEFESKGIHIPVFLISSIAHSCNLFCKGCYARHNGICGETEEEQQLSDDDWARIFDQAADLGICFQLLAGGRGFFHINPYGNAEPCPFSPYSDINVRDHSVQEALQSNLFKKLDEQHLNGEGHSGGCALFEQRERVASICSQGKKDEDSVLHLRPHHLICINEFRGKGYSESFTENMKYICRLLKEGKEFHIVTENDDVCSCCPNAIEGTACASEEKVRRMDRTVMETLGIRERTYTKKETDDILLHKLSETVFEKICGECEWKKQQVCSYSLIRNNIGLVRGE